MLRNQFYEIETSDKSVHGKGYLCYIYENDSYGTPSLYVSGYGELKNYSGVKNIFLNCGGKEKKLSEEELQSQQDKDFEYLQRLFYKLFPPK